MLDDVFNNYNDVVKFIRAAKSMDFAVRSPSYKKITYYHNINREPNISNSQINELQYEAYENKLKLSVFHCC